MNKIVGIALAAVVVAPGAVTAVARLWETSRGLHPTMTRLADPVLSEITPDDKGRMFKDDRVTVDEGARFQKVEGIGSSITDATAWTLMQMDEAVREAVLKQTFAPDGGRYQLSGMTWFLLRRPGVNSYSSIQSLDASPTCWKTPAERPTVFVSSPTSNQSPKPFFLRDATTFVPSLATV